ncbi:PIN domain-containing protein [Kibdelosporangium aridum]|uniref:PIN domain-containing protein n=1 Tax=Kibdelosporangium aridum TaxID=2030 RepID=UPI0035F00C8B
MGLNPEVEVDWRGAVDDLVACVCPAPQAWSWADNAWVMVNLQAGTSPEGLRDTLRELASAASNLRSPAPGWQMRDWLTAYVEWTEAAARRLRGHVTPADVDRLVFTDRRWLLLSKVGMLYPDLENAGLNQVLDAELDDRATAFTKAYQDLDGYIERWSGPGVFVAFDTNVYLHGDDELEEVDFAGLLGLATPATPIRLFVPMAVVDELDNQKQSGKNDVRRRARRTTKVLHRVLGADPAEPQPLREGDLTVRVELVPDPPGHVRLPHADDEIVDRLAAVRALAGRQVTLVTYDTGMAFRAGLAGLEARLLGSADEGARGPSA